MFYSFISNLPERKKKRAKEREKKERKKREEERERKRKEREEKKREERKEKKNSVHIWVSQKQISRYGFRIK